MAEFFAAILKWLKVGPTVWLALLMISGFGLFAPKSALLFFNVDDLASQYSGYLGTCFIASFFFLLSYILAFLFKIVNECIANRKRKLVLVKLLSGLTMNEKDYLRPYIDDGEATQLFEVADGVAECLVKKGILYKPSAIFRPTHGIHYCIDPWAKEYIELHPELLQR